MNILGFNIKKVVKKEKESEEFSFKDEIKQARLEHEKAILEEKLKTIRKQQEYEQKLLDYKIMEQQAKIDEDFSNEVEDVVEEVAEQTDIPEWIKPILPSIIAKFTNQTQPPAATPQPISNTNTETAADGLTLTDEELKTIKQAANKKELELLKGMPDAQVKSVIRQRYPKITEECLERAIIILKQ